MVKGVPAKDFRNKNHEELLSELKKLRVNHDLIIGRITNYQIY
jgi:hypothetical protein